MTSKARMLQTCLLFVVLSVTLIREVKSHGRLVEPPGRSTMWRFGYKNPPNYDDMGLFCGGFSVCGLALRLLLVLYKTPSSSHALHVCEAPRLLRVSWLCQSLVDFLYYTTHFVILVCNRKQIIFVVMSSASITCLVLSSV